MRLALIACRPPERGSSAAISGGKSSRTVSTTTSTRNRPVAVNQAMPHADDLPPRNVGRRIAPPRETWLAASPIGLDRIARPQEASSRQRSSCRGISRAQNANCRLGIVEHVGEPVAVELVHQSGTRSRSMQLACRWAACPRERRARPAARRRPPLPDRAPRRLSEKSVGRPVTSTITSMSLSSVASPARDRADDADHAQPVLAARCARAARAASRAPAPGRSSCPLLPLVHRQHALGDEEAAEDVHAGEHQREEAEERGRAPVPSPISGTPTASSAPTTMTEEMALVTLISGVCSAGVTDQTT